MDSRLKKNIAKWTEENKLLGIVKDCLEKYIALKDGSGEKDDIDRCNAKITGIIEENSWMRLKWKEIKRSKTSRAEGLTKINRKISDRQKKIDEGEKLLSSDVIFSEDGKAAIEVKDWTSAIEESREGSVYYHWAYGKMEVVMTDDDYIYLKLLDKKAVKAPWVSQNNVLIEVDGKVDEMKEFSKYSIGRWLFPKADDVEVPDKDMAHKLFQE